MDTSLNGRVAVVTGSSLGLGLAMAQAFYQAGAKVALIARRAEPLASAKAQIESLAVEAVHQASAEVATFVCDVANAEQLTKTHGAIVARFGAVDILVNNAGKASAKPFMELTDDDWQDDVDLKLMAAVRLTRLVWPQMQARGHGRIINVLNTFAKAPAPRSSPTSVTRAAGMALTKVLAGEGAEHNILVNALLIGLIKSDQIRRAYDASSVSEAAGGNQTFEEFVATAGARLPMKRMGEAHECANLALFLASDAASYITGCAINMDGGMSHVV